MNIQSLPTDQDNAMHDDVVQAVRTLQTWADTASAAEIEKLAPELRQLLQLDGSELARDYDNRFTVDDAYKHTLPDLQNGPQSLIRGEQRIIEHVGISNFRLPLRVKRRDNSDITLETSVTGTVSLEADKKGINMSRIMRSFYKYAEHAFHFDVIESALDNYKTDLESFDARIALSFRFPLIKPSLRSGLEGYQYYDITLETVDIAGNKQRIMHLDYVYSSTCPCSLELSEHARQTRGRLATPHSQRSVARLSAELRGDLCIEDMIELARRAVPTETQVMVKREDEQAFAELNASLPIFVEDAVRLFSQQLAATPQIGDYRVIASHQESLHSHDAVSILTKGDTFAANTVDSAMFKSLYHTG